MGSRETRTVAELRALLSTAQGRRLRELVAEVRDDTRQGVRSAVETAERRETARLAESRRLRGLYALELELARQGYRIVAGVDEVGRGALAGPLTAAAAVLPASPRIPGLDDSKRLSPARREEMACVIREQALCLSVGHVSAREIDEFGMVRALRRAMGRALAGLSTEPDHVVVDGLPVGVAPNETAVVKGDSRVAAVAAASIVAKVTRDALMVELSRSHPEYSFEVNKGYGTSEHLAAIARHGVSHEHRRSFCPGGGADTLF